MFTLNSDEGYFLVELTGDATVTIVRNDLYPQGPSYFTYIGGAFANVSPVAPTFTYDNGTSCTPSLPWSTPTPSFGISSATIAAPSKHHSDPFDPLLIAQALIEALPILTSDKAFASYSIKLLC